MMMSRREIKEEVKRREGDPRIRAKLRELQRENLKQARLGEARARSRRADHQSGAPRDRAALRARRMAAPVVLAKGADPGRRRCARSARRHGIPVYQRTPLARRCSAAAQWASRFPPRAIVDVARIYAELDAKQPRPRRIRGARDELPAKRFFGEQTRARAGRACWAASCWCCSRRFRRACSTSC